MTEEKHEIMIQIPMSTYNQMEHICTNFKKAIEWPIGRLEEELKAAHERAYSDHQRNTADLVAQEILRVAEAWSKEDTINFENQVVKRGSMSATHLIQFLTNYITSASTSEEKKDV